MARSWFDPALAQAATRVRALWPFSGGNGRRIAGDAAGERALCPGRNDRPFIPQNDSSSAKPHCPLAQLSGSSLPARRRRASWRRRGRGLAHLGAGRLQPAETENEGLASIFQPGSPRAQPVARARIIRNNGGNNERTMALGPILRIGTASLVLGAPASSRRGKRSPNCSRASDSPDVPSLKVDGTRF